MIVKNGNGETKHIKSTGAGTELDPYVVYNVMEHTHSEVFFKKLDENGDETGNVNMNVDASVVQRVFKLAPPPGEKWHIDNLIIYVEDAGTFDTGSWGNGVTMINGMMPRFKSSQGVKDLLSVPIRTSSDLASVTHDIKHFDFGTGNEFLSAKWDFTGLHSVILDGDNQEEFQVVIRDDLSELSKQTIQAQGFKE